MDKMQSADIPETMRVILGRRSCRAFQPDEIPQAHIDLLIEALRWAPSAGNRQPWHFYLVKNAELKQKLVDAAYGQAFLAQAPLVFMICAMPEQSAARYRERGRSLYVYQDTAIASENLMLAATALGYGSCWMGAFDESRVSQVLALPPGQRPVAIIPVGKPAENPEPPPRLDRKEVITILE